MNDKNVVKTVIDYIESHLHEDLSLERIAQSLNYSKFYISRTFSEATGNTVYKYIQGRRMTMAAKELVETQKPIIEIAYDAKYNSQQAFTLAFHQVYLCSPMIFRRNGVFYPKQMEMIRRNQITSFTKYRNLGGRMAA